MFGGILFFKSRMPRCSYTIEDLQEFRGNYEGGDEYIVYEGLIKNRSSERHYLKAMIAKIYNKDDVLITEGYSGIGKWLESNKSTFFKVLSIVPVVHDTAVRKYYDPKGDLNKDLYAWFTTCK